MPGSPVDVNGGDGDPGSSKTNKGDESESPRSSTGKAAQQARRRQRKISKNKESAEEPAKIPKEQKRKQVQFRARPSISIVSIESSPDRTAQRNARAPRLDRHTSPPPLADESATRSASDTSIRSNVFEQLRPPRRRQPDRGARRRRSPSGKSQNRDHPSKKRKTEENSEKSKKPKVLPQGDLGANVTRDGYASGMTDLQVRATMAVHGISTTGTVSKWHRLVLLYEHTIRTNAENNDAAKESLKALFIKHGLTAAGMQEMATLFGIPLPKPKNVGRYTTELNRAFGETK